NPRLTFRLLLGDPLHVDLGVRQEVLPPVELRNRLGQLGFVQPLDLDRPAIGQGDPAVLRDAIGDDGDHAGPDEVEDLNAQEVADADARPADGWGFAGLAAGDLV